MTNTTKHTVVTRRERAGHEAKAELTLDWEGVSEEQLRAMATKTIIIKWQQGRKDCETDKQLDAMYAGPHHVRVADIEWGPQRKPRDPKAAARKAIGALTKEQLIALAREAYPEDKLFND